MHIAREKVFEFRYWFIFTLFMLGANIYAITWPAHARYLSSESNFYQNLGAIALFVASLVMVATIWQAWQIEIKKLPKRKIWYGGYTLLLILACGEETSWGQHFFEFEVPESMIKYNEQQELNIHNLKPLHGLNADNSQKTGLLRWFTAHRMFYLVLAGFLVFIPFMNYCFRFFKNLMFKLEMIIPPRWTGILLIMCFLLARTFQYLYEDQNEELYHTLTELMEVHIEITLMLVAFVFLRRARQFNSKSDFITSKP